MAPLGSTIPAALWGFHRSRITRHSCIHAFLWNKEAGRMQDLGTAPGIANTAALAINDSGVVVGVSTDTTHLSATIWTHGAAEDLNTLIPFNSPLHLLTGSSINSRSQIIGLAVDADGNFHGYKLNPVDE
jgi:uncharacterized membrane protein